MVTLSSVALTGMQASQARLGVSAHNVANAQTPGFRPVQVQASEQAGAAGVAVQAQPGALPGVDLAQELVAQKTATYTFKANVQTLRTADAMLGSLLDHRA